MSAILQDLKFAWRQLRRSPVFAGVAVLTLALGIGANTAIFSVMNAVLLRHLPLPDAGRLVYLNTTLNPDGSSQSGEGGTSLTQHVFEELRTQRDVFSSLVGYAPLGFNRVAVRYGSEPEEADADMVSGDFFSGLGVVPVRGRILSIQDENEHAPVAVLSYGYWTRRMARNPSAIGETIYVKGVPFTIVGVAAQNFTGLERQRPTDVWIPLQKRADLKPWGNSAQDDVELYGSVWWCLKTIGRLAPGVKPLQALAKLNPIFVRAAYAGIPQPKPDDQAPVLYFTSGRGIEGMGDQLAQPITVLMTMVGLVLVIACGNVAMLLIARNAARQREFSLRMALGGSRARLFRQLLTESLLLVALGSALGWLFAGSATQALASWSGLSRDLTPDYRVLLFTLGISLLAGLVFGLAPLRSALRVPAGLALKTSYAAGSHDRGGFRSGQVVIALQMALCLMLLAGAGLLVQSLRNLESANLGLNSSGLLVFGVNPEQSVHSDAEAIRFFRALLDRVRTLPGVESATLTANRVAGGVSNNTGALVDGVNPLGDRNAPLRWNSVGPDYFHVMGIPLIEGRDFNDADSQTSAKVAIVNQTFAERYLQKRNPIAHQLRRDGEKETYTIIGVAANSRYTGVRESLRPIAYFPYTQVAGVGTLHVELHTTGNPAAFLPVVQASMHEFAPDLPLLQPMTQQAQFEASYSQERLFARLSMFFGLLAALLVATGLYGTLAYRVSRRTAEIGVRMALGAQRGQVLWMILRESLLVSLVGIVVGLPLAIASAGVLRTMLFGIGPGDPLAFAAAVAGVTIVALVASFIPARRAASVSPIVALRYE
jgi:predicted permease